MNRRKRDFEGIDQIKEKYRKLSTEKLAERYNNAIGYLTKEASIAIRQVLEERGAAHLIGG